MAVPTTTHTITGYFAKRSKAEAAVEALKDAGFNSSEISLAVRPEYDEPASGAYNTEQAEGQKTEGVWNKVVNFFEGKSSEDGYNKERVGSESSQVVGEPVHGYDYDYNDFQGSMQQLDVPEEHAKYFSHQFGQGEEGALVTVAAAGREEEAEAILEKYSGDVGRNAAAFNYTTADAAIPQQETQRVQLFGEVLKVHRDRVQRGEVTIRKNIVTEKKTFEVPVTREELVITRHAVTGDTAAPTGSIGESQDIRIPLSEEQVSLDKQNLVREEVSVAKRSITDSQSISGSVRHEELEIDDSGVNKEGSTAQTRT